jgi:hypothetical protein
MVDSSNDSSDIEQWPELPFPAWKDTCATLHMWAQIIGKIRCALTPWVNHAWHVTFYLTARGLSTSPIPYDARTFQIDFDFIDHRLLIETNDGAIEIIPLRPCPVSIFYRDVMAKLDKLRLPVTIHATPNEVVDAVPFEQDLVHASYDAVFANRFWRALLQSDRVFKQFRTRFIGKCSPVHFFWGSFDLAVTRFSGRTAPRHPGGVPNCPDWITRDAYSHEVSSCGFWPGGDAMPIPVFYAYSYPEPTGYSGAKIAPPGAYYDTNFSEFILPYDQVRTARSPDAVLLEFLESSYAAAADRGEWDRRSLERPPPVQSGQRAHSTRERPIVPPL